MEFLLVYALTVFTLDAFFPEEVKSSEPLPHIGWIITEDGDWTYE